MKKLLMTAAMLAALSVTAHANNPTMPDIFHGEWCAEGGACPDGDMRVTSSGFTGGGDTVCTLQRVRNKAPQAWLLNFKCKEPGRKVERFEEVWMLRDEMLVVLIPSESPTTSPTRWPPTV